jgi:hypothetical protein
MVSGRQWVAERTLIRDGIKRLHARQRNLTGYYETIILARVAVITRVIVSRDENVPVEKPERI